MTVVDKDLGLRKIQEELKLLNGSYTKVGIQDDAGTNKGVSIAEYAAQNEFGVPPKIPARPWMRSTFDKEQEPLKAIKNKAYSRILKGEITVKKALGLIGEYMEGKMKQKITDIRTPPNAPMTIRLKKSSNPLIDSGRMRASVRHVEVLKK